MKDIPIEELAAISAEIHQAAVQIGCPFVSISGAIWPGGQLSGASHEAARFVEFSWLRAAVVNGRAIFEEADPKGFAALLNSYGLGDEPYVEPELETARPAESPEVPGRSQQEKLPAKIALHAEVLPATREELDRQARAAGFSVGEFLDWKFRPPGERLSDG